MTPRIEEKTNRFQIVALEERIAPSLLSICITIGGGKDDGGDGCKPRYEPRHDRCYEPPKPHCPPPPPTKCW